MVSKDYLIDLLKDNEVFLEGDFTLSSGKKSNYYINMKKAITEPEILSTISKLITEKIAGDNIDKVAGPALGAVPIATAVSLESKLPLLMIRKEKKGYGTSKLIEGELNQDDNVIVVEDVSTTGGSLLKAIKAIQDNGGRVVRAFVVVDRQEGAIEEFEKEGIKLEPLINVNEFFDWKNKSMMKNLFHHYFLTWWTKWGSSSIIIGNAVLTAFGEPGMENISVFL